MSRNAWGEVLASPASEKPCIQSPRASNRCCLMSGQSSPSLPQALGERMKAEGTWETAAEEASAPTSSSGCGGTVVSTSTFHHKKKKKGAKQIIIEPL